MIRSFPPLVTTAAATGGLLLAAGPAVATADAPAVGPQKTYTGRTAPLAIPSTGIRRGERLPKGSVLVYRTVDVPHGQRRRARLVVPKGKKLVTVAMSGAFGAVVVGRTDYVGHRSVTVRVAGGKDGARGRVYAYAR